MRARALSVDSRIHELRGQRVMLSSDLAELYGVPAKALIQAVKRNAGRFPSDFMFHLSADEWRILKSQIVTSSWGGARRATPYAFTESGVAMLSSVLRSLPSSARSCGCGRRRCRSRSWRGGWTRSSGATTRGSGRCSRRCAA